MNWRNRQFMADCRAILPLRKRVDLRIKPKLIYRGFACDGIAEQYDKRFTLDIVNNPSRGFWAILAHEWVHFYVMENWPKEPDHGKTFQDVAARLQEQLELEGWTVGPLYDPELDH